MSDTCKLTLEGKEYELPIVVGSENEKAIDISRLRTSTGYITVDRGYGNTGSCQSKVTFIDGENGVLRYRGYPIEQLAENCQFSEVAYLVVFGELPTREQLRHWSDLLTEHEMLHESLQHHFEAFPPNAHPMAILSAMINASSCFYPRMTDAEDRADFEPAAARLISQIRTIASFSYKKSVGHPIIYPKPELTYVENFLHTMFSLPYRDFELTEEIVNAVRLLFILHADHEQNCSTSTVRMVGSSLAGLYASAAAGVCALWGPRHGGANQAVLENLRWMHEENVSVEEVLAKVRNKEEGFRLPGFGHPVYRNYDPRCRIIKDACDKMLGKMGINDPLLDIAKRLEEAALKDEYFIQRNLYPNVDFYSGIIFKAIGIPVNMFTVLFAIGRAPGWCAHWREVQTDPQGRIYRPRQVYQGEPLRHWVPFEKRTGRNNI